ncbi:MAG: hypothetical protein V4467_03825 [Patescibacteria group bacterium]
MTQASHDVIVRREKVLTLRRLKGLKLNSKESKWKQFVQFATRRKKVAKKEKPATSSVLLAVRKNTIVLARTKKTAQDVAIFAS